MSLVNFNSQVLSRGPQAVLPQSLDIEWLKQIQTLADRFFDTQFENNTCPQTVEGVDPILLACVHEIMRSQHGNLADIDELEVVRNVTIYALSITMESIARETGKMGEAPTLENIFSLDRMMQLKETHPDLESFFNLVCIPVRE